MKKFRIEFHGHRKMSNTRKRFYIVTGVVEITIGLFGLFDLNPASSLYFLFGALFISGSGYMILALIGRHLWSERNFLEIDQGKVRYKNSNKKAHTIQTSDIADILIGRSEVDFIQQDEKVLKYDFSVFSKKERADIISALREPRIMNRGY